MPLKKNLRQLMFWFLAFVLFVAVYQNIKGVERERQIPYSEFKAKLPTRPEPAPDHKPAAYEAYYPPLVAHTKPPEIDH